MTAAWTPWRPFATPVRLSPRVLTELVDGGQAFRWWRQPDGTYLGQWADYSAALRLAPPDSNAHSHGGGVLPPEPPASPLPPHRGSDATSDTPVSPQQLEWSAPATQADHLATALPHYLGFTTVQDRAIDQLPWRSDPHLARCLQAFPGLRILRQPFGETLLGFLCSATKQIVQIKQMLALLAEHHGSPYNPARSLTLTCSHPDASPHSARAPAEKPSPTFPQPVCHLISDNIPKPASTVLVSTPPSTCHLMSDKLSEPGPAPSPLPPGLPTWAQLAKIPEAELRACQLGFRAKYIAGTAQFLATHPGWLDETASLSYAEAKTRLLTLPGVGEKIADCVLLFGAGKLEAFPVDTWMIKAMTRRYHLTDWSPTQVAHFGRTHFGPAAGLAQQFLFAWEREFGKDH